MHGDPVREAVQEFNETVDKLSAKMRADGRIDRAIAMEAKAFKEFILHHYPAQEAHPYGACLRDLDELAAYANTLAKRKARS